MRDKETCGAGKREWSLPFLGSRGTSRVGGGQRKGILDRWNSLGKGSGARKKHSVSAERSLSQAGGGLFCECA